MTVKVCLDVSWHHLPGTVKIANAPANNEYLLDSLDLRRSRLASTTSRYAFPRPHPRHTHQQATIVQLLRVWERFRLVFECLLKGSKCLFI
jgi:hypothetical protein